MPENFCEQLNLHLRELVRRHLDGHLSPTLTESAPSAVTVCNADKSAPLWTGSPFPGLRAFTTDDAPIFFGRGRETDELTRRLTEIDMNFIAVVGASGSGKSSLVAAGLLPQLQDNPIGRNWIPIRFTPGSASDPFRALAQALAAVSPTHRADSLELKLCADLSEPVDDILKDHPENAEFLFFIDQFEELFTLVDAPRRGPFIRWLTTAAWTARVRIIVTLRADFYAHCVAW